MAYSTQKISSQLIDEIKKVLRGVVWGSVEIYVQDGRVNQITVRHIKKTSFSINADRDAPRNGEHLRKAHQKSKINQIEVLTFKK